MGLAERTQAASPCPPEAGTVGSGVGGAGPAVDHVRCVSLEAVLATLHAGTRKLRLNYELAGPADAPVVFVAGGISAHRHVAALSLIII